MQRERILISQERKSLNEEIRIDPTERILRFVSVSSPLRKILSHVLNAAYFRIYRTLISVILFWPNDSSSIIIKFPNPLVDRILFPRKSSFLKHLNPSNPSVVLVLFPAKYRSLRFSKWFSFLKCLILLYTKSSNRSSTNCSRPWKCAIRLSDKPSSNKTEARKDGSFIFVI